MTCLLSDNPQLFGNEEAVRSDEEDDSQRHPLRHIRLLQLSGGQEHQSPGKVTLALRR